MARRTHRFLRLLFVNKAAFSAIFAMSPLTGDLEFDGWRIALTFRPGADLGGNFYAAYTGDAFGHPARGSIAAIACGHSGGAAEDGARESAQLAVHSFAEGYFGAQRTLSPKRAANLALHSINAWLFGQIRNDSNRHLAPVSLTAMMFHGARLGVAHIGICRLFRRRAGVITPLTRPHARQGQDPARAIGLDLEISVDYAEEEVEAGDRYLLVSGAGLDSAEVVQAAFEAAPGGNAPPLVAVLLEILSAPSARSGPGEALADLPLRPAPREGDVWDGFVIGRTLYRGRYTVLKLARDSVENRDVVLKIPLPSMLQDEVFAAGFMREAWIGGTVRGSQVARYIELPAERRSSLYLVMPYYQGETLEARIVRAPPMSLPDGIGIALKLCEAVEDLAAIQIVHRDIKPENIMLLARNEVKLLDLGLAYLPGIDRQDVVKPGGTLRYMAPELLRGTQANARSEVYALGVTIYRMFAGGAFPFGQREGFPLARLRPDLPGWMGEILRRALAQAPGDRFADAGALAAALQEKLAGALDDPPAPAWRWPAPLHVYQGLTVLFAALSLFLWLRGK